MYSQAYLADETTPPVTDPAATPTAVTTVAQPAAPTRQWRRYPSRFSPRQQMPRQASNAVSGGQFYDHQMALAAQQNAQQQQTAQAAAPEPSGIGGISWPVIALAGGGFLMLMMVMMSGKK